MKAALTCVMALLAAVERPAVLRDTLPPDLPLGPEGVPTRPLDDAELHRPLLALSPTNEAAAVLLAACHAAGCGYGMPGWRGCVHGAAAPR